MQKIDNIEIKNFKSIRHQKIEGCKRINVFIGYPNVGKSNILEALSLFSVNKESSFDLSSLVRFESPALLFFDGDSSKHISVKINRAHELTVIPGSPYPLDFYYVINKDDNPTWNYNYSLLPDERSITPFESKELNENIGLCQIKKYEFKKNILFESGSLKTLLHPNGSNLFDVISGSELIKREITEFFKQYNLKFSFDIGTKAFKIIKDVGDDIFLIPYSMIADTLQRLIFYKTAILSNKDCILLFEEPESQMFPPYIAKLTTDIIFDENNNQYFIATHSPYVLNEFIEEAQNDLAIYLVDYDKGETVIKRLTDEEVSEVAQYGIDLFFNLETYLDKYEQPHSA